MLQCVTLGTLFAIYSVVFLGKGLRMGKENILYLVGWVTPLAMLELKRTLAGMARGETILVIVEGETLLHNIEKTVLHSPDVILDQKDHDGKIHLTIRKGTGRGQGDDFPDHPPENRGEPA